MIAYPDGNDARVGDEVRLAHGEHKGIVQQVIESAEEIEAWGLDAPGLMVDTSYGGLVFYPKRSLKEEIVFVSRATG
jgi:hypothetical protein